MRGIRHPGFRDGHVPPSNVTVNTRAFPDNFLWGVAGSGHQTEGDNVDSDTWFLENVTPTVFREPSAKACDSWNRWREDVDLAAAMNLTAYRFSVEWARVEPTEGVFSDEALDHYEAIVDVCLEHGMTPVVTLNHFTSPHWFAKKGGWLDDGAPAAFARYCDAVMARFGDRIGWAITFNEPNLTRVLSWYGLPQFVHDLERVTLEAASVASGVERYRVGNVCLPEDFDALEQGMTAGHVAAREVIKSRRPDLPVGLSLAIMDDVVVGDDPSVRDRKRSECYQHFLEVARDDDFIGVQNYERVPYDAHGKVEAPEGAERNQMGTVIEPASLAGAARWAHEVSGVPVLVTEHGMATTDDRQRAGFIEPSLVHLLDAIEDGVPVVGYTHWTLLDNFEWIFGYDYQLGLHEVDRETFERTAKPSVGVLAAIAKANAVQG